MDFNDLLEPFDRLLGAVATPAAVRAVEAGGDTGAMWNAIAESGFLDALVAETGGGFGLPLTAVEPLWRSLGRHAVPLPVGETMIARALLESASIALPDGPVALASSSHGGEFIVPFGRVAANILVETAAGMHLVEAESFALEPVGVFSSLAARAVFEDRSAAAPLAAPASGLRALSAVLRTALIAGAAERVTAMTALYANERVQFGKPIGRQQALQQQMAVMAEDMVACRIASQIGCSGSFPPPIEVAAIAKSTASQAAAEVAATAHFGRDVSAVDYVRDLTTSARRSVDDIARRRA